MAEKSSELTILSATDKNPETENPSDERISAEVPSPADELEIETETGETEKIRDQIEDTRREMGETIDAIQEKLSFSNISEQVKEQVSEQINSAVETAKAAVYQVAIKKTGDFMQNIGREIKKLNIVKTAGENPIPLILIGLGAGLLVFKSFNKNSGSKTFRKNTEGKPNKPSLLASAQNKVSDVASHTYENVSSAAGSAYESVSGAASSAYRGVGSLAGNTYEKVGDLGTQAREQYDYYIEENPLAVGAIALAVGAAVGLAIPSTSYENKLLGETREKLLSKAEEVTRGAIENARQTVADEVGKNIKEAAKS